MIYDVHLTETFQKSITDRRLRQAHLSGQFGGRYTQFPEGLITQNTPSLQHGRIAAGGIQLFRRHIKIVSRGMRQGIKIYPLG